MVEAGPRVAVAVVTMGNRPVEVDALLASVAKQDVAPERIVIVGNGCPLPEFAERLGLPGEVTLIEVDENLDPAAVHEGLLHLPWGGPGRVRDELTGTTYDWPDLAAPYVRLDPAQGVEAHVFAIMAPA